MVETKNQAQVSHLFEAHSVFYLHTDVDGPSSLNVCLFLFEFEIFNWLAKSKTNEQFRLTWLRSLEDNM